MSRSPRLRKCDVCGQRKAVVLQRHTGRALCKECFIEDVIARVRNEVSKYKMFTERDSLLLALSGGKDGFVLLDVLLKIHDPRHLGIITVVEGIRGYDRREQVSWVRDIAREYGIEHYMIPIKDYVGHDLSELVTLAEEKGVRVSPCTFCGIIRRRVMNSLARELGYDRVVTGHTLDDEAQTALMNILRGDVLRLVQSHPAGPVLSRRFVRRVKPLRKIYEVEIAAYSYLKGFKFQELECPYITQMPTLRAWLRQHLYKLEWRSPGSLLRFLTIVDDLVKKLIPEYSSLPELPRCVRCGEPTAYGRKYCKLCELLLALGVEEVPRLDVGKYLK